MSDADCLTTDAVLTLTEVAAVLKLTHIRGAKRGMPDRRQALELIGKGKLRVVDADQPNVRWTVSTAEIRRYLNGAAA